MTKLSSAFNLKDSIRIKSFELGGHTFKVKVPLNKDLEEIIKRITDIPQEIVAARLKKMTDALTDSVIDGVEIKDDDVIVDGRSTKETVISVIQMERRITEYMKLLVPENGSIDDITYEEIDEVFPLQVQLEIIEKITEAIQPGYKDARKN
jgi:hypothetical protein